MSFNNIQGNFEAELINRSLSPCWAGPTASRFFLDQYAKLCIDHHEDNFGAPANPTWSKIPTNGGQHLHCISSHLMHYTMTSTAISAYAASTRVNMPIYVMPNMHNIFVFKI
jgi:hypothetical protein